MTIRRLDHVIFAAEDMSAALGAWKSVFSLEAEPPYQPEGAHLRMARLNLASGAFLEVAEATVAGHRLARFVAERGEGMFSISVEVDDLTKEVADLRAAGVTVSDPEPGAWPGTRLARIPRAAAHGVAVQLIERKQGS